MTDISAFTKKPLARLNGISRAPNVSAVTKKPRTRLTLFFNPITTSDNTIFPVVPVFDYPFQKIPEFTEANFTQLMLNLEPNGRAWAKYTSSDMFKALAVLSPTYEAMSKSAKSLLADIFPPNTYQMLPEWELSLGLPDPCAGPFPSTDVARAQVVARFIFNGGQSIPFIIAYAKQLGFDITITESKRPFRMGLSTMGGPDAFGGDGSEVFYWYVNSPLFSQSLFRMGVNVMGDPLGVFENNMVLECELQAIAPAQTRIVFNYN